MSISKIIVEFVFFFKYFFPIVFNRFWYVSLVACFRNITTCRWQHTDAAVRPNNHTNGAAPANWRYELHYDFQLVNGNPNQSSLNPLTFHFSFDQQNILEMNLCFFLVYLVLVPLQLYAVRIQLHPVTKLFTLSLILEFVSLCLILVYMVRYAIGGIGNETMKTAGDILDILSRVNLFDVVFGKHNWLFFCFRLRLCWFYCCWPKAGRWRDSKSVRWVGWFWCQSGFRTVHSTWSCTFGIGCVH